MSYRHKSWQELSETCLERKNLFNFLIKLDKSRLVEMAYSWEGHKDCDFTETSNKDIVELILDALGATDWTLEV